MGVGTKAIGEAKGVLGGKSFTKEIRGNEKIDVELSKMGDLSPFPQGNFRKMQ
jgi:hypothetical protein